MSIKLNLEYIVLVSISGLFLLLLAVHVPIPMLYYYDDGVYYGSVVETVSGKVPYKDYYLAHPPGLIWVNVPLRWAGGGIVASRSLSFLLSLMTLFFLARLVRNLVRDENFCLQTSWMTVIFIVSTAGFQFSSSQCQTQTPGTLLVIISMGLLIPEKCRPILAGLLLAVATMFRVQYVYFGPAFVAFMLATYGWKTSLSYIVRFTLTSVITSVVIHGIMAFTHDGYFDCVVRSHLGRAPTSLGDKISIFNELFREPQIAFGLFSAAILSFSSTSPVRGLATFTLLEMFLTLFGSRFLGEGYFFPSYPFLAACGAILLGREAARIGSPKPFLMVAMIILFCLGMPSVRRTTYRWNTQRTFEIDLIARVEATPGRTVMCVLAKVPLFAGKELVRDYRCPDTTSPIMKDFGPWFVAMCRKADIVVITDTALALTTASECIEIFQLSKPIVFAKPEDEAEFNRRVSKS